MNILKQSDVMTTKIEKGNTLIEHKQVVWYDIWEHDDVTNKIFDLTQNE